MGALADHQRQTMHDDEEAALFAKLRLLQQSRLCRSQYAAKEQILATTLMQEEQPEVQEALLELDLLKRQLEKIEIAEARVSARIIAAAINAKEVMGAKRLQASFHGMLGRKCCRGLREERRHHAASILQAGFHGLFARTEARHLRALAEQRMRAACTMQAGARGYHARKFIRSQLLSPDLRSGSTIVDHQRLEQAQEWSYVAERI